MRSWHLVEFQFEMVSAFRRWVMVMVVFNVIKNACRASVRTKWEFPDLSITPEALTTLRPASVNKRLCLKQAWK